MDKDYTKRELDEKFGDITKQLDRIEVQTTKTNGKVAELKSWQSFIKGGLAILTVIVIPIILYLINMKVK